MEQRLARLAAIAGLFACFAAFRTCIFGAVERHGRSGRARVAWIDADTNLRGGCAESQPAVRPVLLRALQLSLSDPRRADDRRSRVSWRTLNLENEYLRVTVLPDLGGHLYSCLDKRSGREMFYANTSIKKALIGYRGAWAAFGVEFNFPVSHNWMSMSPVDFATCQNADGSGSIWVGNIDQVYGVAVASGTSSAARARSVLEQHVDLYNPSDVAPPLLLVEQRRPCRSWDDSQLVYPTELMATHGFTRVEPLADRSTRDSDLSVIRNQVDGPVSLFTYDTREAFVGVYHPHTHSGTVHVADPCGTADA